MGLRVTAMTRTRTFLSLLTSRWFRLERRILTVLVLLEGIETERAPSLDVRDRLPPLFPLSLRVTVPLQRLAPEALQARRTGTAPVRVALV
ncbi:hypothetical protein LCGC14_2901570, partial [marine sediment metagenome]